MIYNFLLCMKTVYNFLSVYAWSTYTTETRLKWKMADICVSEVVNYLANNSKVLLCR